MNMIHSEASPEELSEEVYDSEVCGTSSYSAAAASANPSRLTWFLDKEGILGPDSSHLRDRGFSSKG